MNMEQETELKKLEDVKEKYHEVIEDLDLMIASLPKKYQHNEDLLDSLLKQYTNKRRVIVEGLKKPYFARIDFKGNNQDREDICYIGKVGVYDFDNNIITVDWRAPIASLYYDSNLGRAEYQSPDGKITGEMLLKRQYDIENGVLKSFNDVDTVANDEILKPYLSVNADNRLKNIVSSIQEEQNQVIRKYIYDNLIIQGVAGSGKTTVALHRIAYLAYNYRNLIDSNQYMVIGPNKFFIKYISSVLPDLDVVDVPQLTFDELCLDYLEEKIEIIYRISKDNKININKYKLSMNYKDSIDKYINYLEQNDVVPTKDLIINDYKILNADLIKKTYDSISDDVYNNIESKINKTILLCSTYIKNNKDQILTDLYNEYIQRTDEKNNYRVYNELKKEITNNNGSLLLKKYFTFLNKKTTSLYNNFITNICNYCNDDTFSSQIKKDFQRNKTNTYNFDDLAGLMYLHYKLHGSQKYKNYRHTIVDEAQDYGLFNFFVLRKVLNSSSFSIFGDLAQSIYDYRSIDSWDDVKDIMFNNDCSIEYLLKSYRTTIEIMNEANKVLNYIGLRSAEPVIRHGEKVKYIKSSDMFNDLYHQINLLKLKKYNSIALISSRDEMVSKVYNELKKKDIDLHIINDESLEYEDGVCSVSSKNSKGLEFDAVIIVDASENSFDSHNSSDMKSLYVSMTRALHEMVIIYETELTKPLV